MVGVCFADGLFGSSETDLDVFTWLTFDFDDDGLRCRGFEVTPARGVGERAVSADFACSARTRLELRFLILLDD